MFIRMTTGPYAGKVRDVVYESARALIATGQAEEAKQQLDASQKQLVRTNAVQEVALTAPAPQTNTAPQPERRITGRRKR